MRLLRMVVPVTSVLLLSACGANSVCDEPKLYEQSQLGKRIEAPEGLSPLQAGREMTIPDASPRDPRPDGAPCLELPPAFTSDE